MTNRHKEIYIAEKLHQIRKRLADQTKRAQFIAMMKRKWDI